MVLNYSTVSAQACPSQWNSIRHGNLKIGNLKNGNFQIGSEVILKWNGPSGPP